MNYNPTYARAAIQGEISIGPERQAYGEKGDKELVKFTIVVTRPAFGENPPVRMPFQVTCFGKQAELALTLKRNQHVLVICDLRSKQTESNGYVFDNISVTATMILPFAMPQQETQQQPQQHQQAPQHQQQPRILQNQGIQYNPQQDLQNRLQQQGNMSNTDIPF